MQIPAELLNFPGDGKSEEQRREDSKKVNDYISSYYKGWSFPFESTNWKKDFSKAINEYKESKE